MKNQLIIWFGECLRNDWDRVWQREQEVCSWLAKDNTVIYVERLNMTNRSLLAAIRGATKRLVSFIKGPSASAKMRRLRFLQPILIPFHLSCFERINSILLSYQIKRRLPDNHNTGFLIWISNPSKFTLLAMQTLPRPLLTVYQCTERYQYRNEFNLAEVEFEKEISQKADLVTVHSKISMAEKLELNKNTFFIPESSAPREIDFATSQANLESAELKRKGDPKICYFGSFHHVFDFELVRLAAEFYNKYQFIIWGPVTSAAMEKLGHLKNVKLEGFLPHNEVLQRLYECDVCIIPYIRNEFSMGVFPHKLFTYLASGRPIVSSRMPELETFASWVDLADDHETFLQLLGKAVVLARDPKYMASRSIEIPHLLHKYSLNENLHKLDQKIEKMLDA